MQILNVTGLKKVYTTRFGGSQVTALRQVDFSVEEGEYVAIMGESGSGKTTTAMRLQEYLQNLGVKVCLLSMDNFFLPLDKRPPRGHRLGVSLLRGRGHPADLHLPAAGRHGGRYSLV